MISTENGEPTEKSKYSVFFEIFYINIPTLIFYLLYYRRLLENGTVRFFALNLEKKLFRKYLFSNVFVVWIVMSFSVIMFYLVFYFPQSEITSTELLKKIFYFMYFQLFQSLISLVLLSLSKSIWTVFIVVFYAMSENTLIPYLQSIGSKIMWKFLPFELFKNLIRFDFSMHNLLSLFYVAIFVIFIYTFNYKRI